MLNTEPFRSSNTKALEWLVWLAAVGWCFFIKFDEAFIFLSLMSCFFEREDLETLDEHVIQHGC